MHAVCRFIQLQNKTKETFTVGIKSLLIKSFFFIVFDADDECASTILVLYFFDMFFSTHSMPSLTPSPLVAEQACICHTRS